MTLTKKPVHTTDTGIDDFVRGRTFAEIYEDGQLLDTVLISDRLIKPTDDYSNEAGKIRRACDGQFVQTLKDRQTAQDLYETAKQAREQAVQAREASIQAKADAFEARGKTKTAHDLAVASGEGIDVALALKDEAIALHATAVTAHDKAVTAATKARTAMETAKTARDKARIAHDLFIKAEG